MNYPFDSRKDNFTESYDPVQATVIVYVLIRIKYFTLWVWIYWIHVCLCALSAKPSLQLEGSLFKWLFLCGLIFNPTLHYIILFSAAKNGGHGQVSECSHQTHSQDSVSFLGRGVCAKDTGQKQKKDVWPQRWATVLPSITLRAVHTNWHQLLQLVWNCSFDTTATYLGRDSQ